VSDALSIWLAEVRSAVRWQNVRDHRHDDLRVRKHHQHRSAAFDDAAVMNDAVTVIADLASNRIGRLGQ